MSLYYVCIVVILLLSGGLAAGLYVALRPDPEIRPTVTPDDVTPSYTIQGRADLPCPKMYGMTDKYTQDTCKQQPR